LRKSALGSEVFVKAQNTESEDISVIRTNEQALTGDFGLGGKNMNQYSATFQKFKLRLRIKNKRENTKQPGGRCTKLMRGNETLSQSQNGAAKFSTRLRRMRR
jgi:hypothetical protein